jgi:hypothetical protein
MTELSGLKCQNNEGHLDHRICPFLWVYSEKLGEVLE